MFLRNNAKRLNVKSASKVVKSGNPQKIMTKSKNILKSDSVKSASKVKTSKVPKRLIQLESCANYSIILLKKLNI